jgi:hypothetical protein
MKKIRYLLVSWNDIRLQPREIPKLRGFFAHKFADFPLFHNHTPGRGFNYAAPRIQYRLIDSHPALLAFGEGIDLLKMVFMEVDELEINGRTLRSNEREISLREEDFGRCEEYHQYRFASPWMALNQENHKLYDSYDDYERKQLLKTILKNNLKTLSKAFDYWIPDVENLNVDGWFRGVNVNFHNQAMQCFYGDFTTNFHIPQYLGLGKQSARGFGVVIKQQEER